MKCKGGLLIPLDDHVDVYCNAPNYLHCLQYSCQVENKKETLADGIELSKNRRKFRRLSTSHKITVTKVTGASETVPQVTTLASTLDVSKEGMRLSTPVPLANGTVVQFFIHDSSSEDLQSGIGQITWCNKYVDEPGYQVGVLFQRKSYIEAMGDYLGPQPGYM